MDFENHDYRLYQEFTFEPNHVLGEGFDIYIRASIKWPDGSIFVQDEFLTTVYDLKQAQAFCDRLNKHWDDIYEIPRWCTKFYEIHGNMNGSVDKLGI